MSRPGLLLAVGGVSFVLFLVATLPARLVGQLASSYGVTLFNPAGTVWQGRATALRGAGLALQEIDWDLHQLRLLTGRLGAELSAELPGGFLRTRLSLSPGGRLSLRDTEAAGPLSALAGIVGLPLTGGDFSVQLERLEFRNGWPVAATGEVRLGNLPLGLPAAGITAGSGSFLASFEQPEPADELVGELRDLGGVLELAGTLRLAPPRDYAIEALVRARPEAPPELRQGLALLGPEERDGRHRFSMAGSL